MQYFNQAQWIFAVGADPEAEDRYYEYETVLTLTDSTDVKLYLGACDQYALWVNGEFVNYGVVEGYEDLQFYDTLTLDAYLHSGVNVLRIGHYAMCHNFSTRRKQHPGVIFEVWQGEVCLLASAPGIPSRRVAQYEENGEMITTQLGFNCSYNANLSENDWAPAVASKKTVRPVPRPIRKQDILPPRVGKLVAQGVYMETDKTLPKAQRMLQAFLSARREEDLLTDGEWKLPEKPAADGVYFVADLGEECAGLLGLTLEVPRETEVLIGFGEHLDDLRVRSFVGGRNFCLRYVAKPGRNEFFHPYQRLGLRYIQVHIASPAGKLEAITLRETNYPVNDLGFARADALEQKIVEVAKRTLLLCMHEHYEDCPWREQALYTMDSRVQMLCGYYAFGEYAFPRASLALAAHSLREDGQLELCPPSTLRITIPSFTAIYIRQVLEYTRYSGDWSLAQEVLPVMEAIARSFMNRVDNTGLFPLFQGGSMNGGGRGYWNFIEWKPGLVHGDPVCETIYESPICAFASDAWQCLATLCDTLKPEASAGYRAAAKSINEAIHKHFYDEKTGGYRTCMDDAAPKHMLTQALVLWAGAVPEDKRKSVAELVAHNHLIPCTVSMTIYAYDALMAVDPGYGKFIREDIRRIWGDMLCAGATTFWETAEGANDFRKAGSLCHGWSAVPIYVWGRYGL